MLPKYQLQLSGAGFANLNNTAGSLVVNADTNASFVGNGSYDSLAMNWGSSGAAIVSQATQVLLWQFCSGSKTALTARQTFYTHGCTSECPVALLCLPVCLL